MDAHFRKVEEEYFQLRGQVQVGRITQEQFEARLKDLLVQDAQGRYWMLGVNDANWYVHTGTSWTQATPPTETAAAPVAPRSEPRPPISGPTAPAVSPRSSQSGNTLWLVVASAILGAAIAVFFSTVLSAVLSLSGARALGPIGLVGCPLAIIFLPIVIVLVRRSNRA